MHNNMYYTGPMEAYDPNHDTGSKTLLNGQVLPAGQTAAKDLNDALLNVFNHPNVGPFIAKLLIQHLVMSNPSPAYVQRVGAMFNNNGSGVRGDLKAVVQAILLDAEARAGDPPTATPATGGHLRQPVSYFVACCGRSTPRWTIRTTWFGMGPCWGRLSIGRPACSTISRRFTTFRARPCWVRSSSFRRRPMASAISRIGTPSSETA